MKYFLLLLSLLVSLSSNAGTESSGGGGNVLVCFRDQENGPTAIERVRRIESDDHRYILDSDLAYISSIETLDLLLAKVPLSYYETETKIYKENSAPQNPDQYVEAIANRLQKDFKSVNEVILNGKNNFSNGRVSSLNKPISKIHDSDPIINEHDLKEKNCTFSTMAKQLVSDNIHYMQIDSRLFLHEMHSNLSRGVLMLHEYIYSEYRKKNLEKYKTSRQVQLLVRIVIRVHDSLTVDAIKKELSSLLEEKVYSSHDNFLHLHLSAIRHLYDFKRFEYILNVKKHDPDFTLIDELTEHISVNQITKKKRSATEIGIEEGMEISCADGSGNFLNFCYNFVGLEFGKYMKLKNKSPEEENYYKRVMDLYTRSYKFLDRMNDWALLQLGRDFLNQNSLHYDALVGNILKYPYFNLKQKAEAISLVTELIDDYHYKVRLGRYTQITKENQGAFSYEMARKNENISFRRHYMRDQHQIEYPDTLPLEQ